MIDIKLRIISEDIENQTNDAKETLKTICEIAESVSTNKSIFKFIEEMLAEIVENYDVIASVIDEDLLKEVI